MNMEHRDTPDWGRIAFASQQRKELEANERRAAGLAKLYLRDRPAWLAECHSRQMLPGETQAQCETRMRLLERMATAMHAYRTAQRQQDRASEQKALAQWGELVEQLSQLRKRY